MDAQLELATTDLLGHEVLRLGRLIERAISQHHVQPSGDGLERACVGLLVHLIKGGPQRASALAESAHSDPSTVSRQIAQLVQLGLIERRPDPLDGRASLLAATAEGERVFEQKRRWRNELFAAMLAHWSAEDLDALHNLLSRFNDDFEEHRDTFAGLPRP